MTALGSTCNAVLLLAWHDRCCRMTRRRPSMTSTARRASRAAWAALAARARVPPASPTPLTSLSPSLAAASAPRTRARARRTARTTGEPRARMQRVHAWMARHRADPTHSPARTWFALLRAGRYTVCCLGQAVQPHAVFVRATPHTQASSSGKGTQGGAAAAARAAPVCCGLGCAQEARSPTRALPVADCAPPPPPPRAARAACRYELQLDFMEAVFGCSKELEVDRLAACTVRGEGREAGRREAARAPFGLSGRRGQRPCGVKIPATMSACNTLCLEPGLVPQASAPAMPSWCAHASMGVASWAQGMLAALFVDPPPPPPGLLCGGL